MWIAGALKLPAYLRLRSRTGRIDLCPCDLGIISDDLLSYLSICARIHITVFPCVSTPFSCCLLLDLTIWSISQIGFTHLVCLIVCHTLLRRCNCQLLASDLADSFGSRLLTCSTVATAAVVSGFIHMASPFAHVCNIDRLTNCLISCHVAKKQYLR